MWLVENPKAIEISESRLHREVFNIKRYCRDVDITNIEFIKESCYAYFEGKWGRRDVQRFIKSFKEKECEAMPVTVGRIARHIKCSLITKRLNLKPIRYFDKIDGMSGKERIIGVQSPLHQIYDYIAVRAMKPMLDAKIGVFQCASLPGKGQSYGKKYIERWIKDKKTSYFVKGDIKKCFPSTSIPRLMELLNRDIKNESITWLLSKLLSMFKSGLSIGSYLSQYLCNYFLSYAYHYASEKLFKTRKKRAGEVVRVRLINHVLFYMDDFLLTGSSKKDLKKAMCMTIKYLSNFLELTVKPGWKISKVSDTEPIDMMGFVFRRDRTTIRARIFLKTRRYFYKARKRLKLGLGIPIKLAYQIVSAYGWYKNTDSYKARMKLKINYIVNLCKVTISKYMKGELRNANNSQLQAT